MQDNNLPIQGPACSLLHHANVDPGRLECRVLDLILQTPDTSTRLANVIREASDVGRLPFQTVGDFLAAGKDAAEQFRSIPKLGTKTLNELQAIVARFCFGGDTIPWSLLIHEPQEVSVPPHLEVSLLSFINSGDPVSVRLRNCIVYAEQEHLLPFATVGDYIRAGALGPRLFRKLPSVGTGTALEFDARVQAARGGANSAVGQDDAFDLMLEGRFPDLGSVVHKILEGMKENQVVIARMRLGHGKTLDAVAQILGVTRERVRQIEAKLRRNFTLAKLRLLKSGATLLQHALGANSTHEIFVGDLAAKCSATLEELRIFLGLLKQVEPDKYGYFSFSDDFLFLADQFAPQEEWDELVHQALITSEMPITLSTFVRHCHWGVPAFYVITRLCKRYEASIVNGEFVQQPKLSTYVMCEALAHKAGGPFHFSEICARIQDRYGLVLSGHTVLATLGRMQEVAICGPGMYVHYAHLSCSTADRDRLCGLVEQTLTVEGCFLSSKLLFARLKDRLKDYPDLNHYLLMGIAQDDSRFITKRGNMVGLASFDVSATFTALEDEVCQLVKDFGPITISEIVDRVSKKRELCNDSGVRLILSSEPWIVEVAYRTYDTSWRVLGSEEALERYNLAIKISLLAGTKSGFAIAEDLKSVGLSKATPELISSMMESIHHVLAGSSYRVVNLPPELEEYALFAQELLADGAITKQSPTPEMARFQELDPRFSLRAPSRTEYSKTELGAILAEFEF